MFEAAIVAICAERAVSRKRQGKDLDALWDSDLKEVPFENIALGLIRNQGMLQNLSRYETSLLNAYDRTLHQFLVLQERRAHQEAEVVDVVSV